MGLLDELIAECDCALAERWSYHDINHLRWRIYSAYRKEIIEGRATKAFDGSDTDVSVMKTWLVAHKERRDHELAVAQANAGNVSVSANSQAMATASIEATFNNTMSQMWALPDDVLVGEQKQKLAKLLQAVEDSGKDEGKLKKTGKAVVDWLFDNAIRAIPTVMPYVTQAIGSIVG